MKKAARVVLAAVICLGASALPAAAASKWSIARSPHFTVVGDTGERSLRDTARQFEQFRTLVRSALNLRADPTRPVVVFAVDGERGVKELWPSQRVDTPGGFFIKGGQVHYIVTRADITDDGRYHTIYHEYVHLLNDLNFGRLPAWLNEGLADFYATADIDGERVQFARISPYHLGLLRNSASLPLARLFAIDHSSPEYAGGHGRSIFYAQSAALTHYLMMHERGAHRRQLAEFLNQLARGATEEQATQRAFGSLDALEKSFESYLRRFQFYSVRGTGTFDARTVTAGPLSEADALSYQAEYALRIGRAEHAAALVERAVAADAQSGLAQRALGLLRTSQGRVEEARDAFGRATKLAPDDLLAHFHLGTTRIAPENDEARARREQALLRAVELQPAHAPSLAALSALLLAAGRKDDAIQRAAAAYEAEPREVGWGLRLSHALRSAGRAPEADALESALIASAHSDPRVLYEAVLFLQRNDREAEGQSLLTRVQAANPRQPALQRALGDLLSEAGRHDDAEKAYRAALAQSRDNVEVLNALGYMNADRNLAVPEALELIDKALGLRPNAPHLLDSRGWALFRLQRLPEAEKELRRAAAALPDPAVLDHLAQVLSARGAQDEAAALWRKALADPEVEDDLKAAIERRLAPASPAP